jgi:uroporphyrinogen-III synthase
MRLIVTRPAAQAAPWVQALRAQGLDAVALPLIRIEALADTRALAAAWHTLADHALVMFVSANAVEHFFGARPSAAAWPANVVAGSTGPGTTQALRERGVDLIEEPAADAPQFDSEALWQRLQSRSWQGRRVLLVRGEQGRDWLANTLRAAGATVQALPAYRRLPPDLEPAPALAQALASPQQHRWLFSSSEAVQQLQLAVPGEPWHAHHAWCSHPRIAQATHDAGFGQVRLVPPGLDAVIELARAG